MCSLRSDFTNSQVTKVLREICSESRQKLWKTNPSLIFNVKEKELKRVKKEPISTEKTSTACETTKAPFSTVKSSEINSASNTQKQIQHNSFNADQSIGSTIVNVDLLNEYLIENGLITASNIGNILEDEDISENTTQYE